MTNAERPTPPLAAAAPSTGAVPDDFLPNRAMTSMLGAAAGIAADAPTVAGWGYATDPIKAPGASVRS